jgi:hypothetical protein
LTLKESFVKVIIDMPKKKHPKIRALENKVEKLQTELSKYVLAEPVVIQNEEGQEELVINQDDTLAKGLAISYNKDKKMYEAFILDVNINKNSFQVLERKNIGDSEVRARFELQKIFAHNKLFSRR